MAAGHQSARPGLHLCPSACPLLLGPLVSKPQTGTDLRRTHTIHPDTLHAGPVSRHDLDLVSSYAELTRQEANQRSVRCSVHGRGREAYAQSFVTNAPDPIG